jgi:hypothetical protein
MLRGAGRPGPQGEAEDGEKRRENLELHAQEGHGVGEADPGGSREALRGAPRLPRGSDPGVLPEPPEEPENYVVTTPDLDNLEKALLDGLNEVAYTDDRLVVVKSSAKMYVKPGEEPRVSVVVAPLRNQMRIEEYLGD